MQPKLTVREYVTIALAAAALATAAPLFAQATDVYKWTDENGVVHFSDMKPADAEAQNLEVNDRTGFSRSAQDDPARAAAPSPAKESTEQPELTAAQQRRQEIAEAREAQRLEQVEIQQWCDKHRKRLVEMEPARRVYTYDENGQQVRMDDDTRVALIEESRAYLSENCQ